MSRPGLPRIAALCGPTGCGKTAIAVALRGRGLPIEVVSCDALQVYRQLDAGTAKPTAEERAAVPTHLVDVVHPSEAMTAGRWADSARAAMADVAGRGRWPLVVGGTGLYYRALVRGLAQIPAVDQALRGQLADRWAALGAPALHAELARVDPAYAATTPVANRQRVLRALEVHAATGQPLSHWHLQTPAPRFEVWLAVLEPEPGRHAAAVERRARAMAGPLLAEVAALLRGGMPATAPAMQALGYRDAAQIVLGNGDPAGFADRLARDHLHYAKRQRTWFRSEAAALRIDPAAADAVDRIEAGVRAWFGAAVGLGPITR
ncbi:MAG: tRNA (adenosine(37)-N6)-dimethylallyltransferase MiaA [Deltaproteobacteria bacterium]|nr:tRNA (adenosine(37)-N6)-dimethylallyltransferase MiaA [Deltaproteobacteria bacterium]